MRLAVVVSCLAWASAALPTPVRAQEPMDDPVRWKADWRQVGWADHAVGLGLFGAAALTWLFVGNADDPWWEGPAPGETPVRDALVAETYEGRSNAALVSDILWHATWSHALLVDALAVSGGVYGDGELALHLASIDGVALAGTTLVTMLAQGLILRERPYGPECELDESYDDLCERRERYRSFISGHSSVAAASAALTCVHHAKIPLYGGGAPDVAACVVSSAFAVTSGLMRIVADQHYLTDVLAGLAVGAAFGLGVPLAFYY